MSHLNRPLPQPIAAFDEFLANNPDWGKSTGDLYRYTMMRLGQWMQDNNLDLEHLTIRLMNEFLHEQGWGNSLQRRTCNCLRPFMDWKFGPKHHLANWRVKHYKSARKRTVHEEKLTDLFSCFQPGISKGGTKEARRLIMCDTAKPTGLRNQAMVRLLADTALRSDELVNLRLRELDLDGRRLTTKIKGGDEGVGRFEHATEIALRAWLEVRPDCDNDKVFVSPGQGKGRGTPMTPSGLRAMLRKLAKVHSLGPLSPHDFRRGFVVFTMKKGAPITVIQYAGRWENPQMMLHYSRDMEAESIRPYLPGNLINVPVSIPIAA
ncbi:MAG: site-specific integrase [Anaerolineales bacterium]|nr:site-specific integrase [Anaerolineales bacterium]